jgi:tryptophan synthase alpha chain
MSSLKNYISNNDKNLSVYFTAGYPTIDSMADILKTLNDTSVDFIEVGIPFSDPLADGPIIQNASQVALNNGMSLKLIFEKLNVIKKEISKPYILMGYLNSVLAYGLEQFYKDCHQSGVKNVILPDLPLNEYIRDHKKFSDIYNVNLIFLITPNTPFDRIKLIDRYSKSFIYLVSDNSTTGGNNQIQVSKIEKIKNLNLKNPLIIGFGITNKNDFDKACQLSKGAIIGSAFIKKLDDTERLKNNIVEFISSIKQ